MRLLFSFSFFSSSKRCFPLYPFYPTFDIRNITPPTFEYIHLNSFDRVFEKRPSTELGNVTS